MWTLIIKGVILLLVFKCYNMFMDSQTCHVKRYYWINFLELDWQDYHANELLPEMLLKYQMARCPDTKLF